MIIKPKKPHGKASSGKIHIKEFYDNRGSCGQQVKDDSKLTEDIEKVTCNICKKIGKSVNEIEIKLEEKVEEYEVENQVFG